MVFRSGLAWLLSSYGKAYLQSQPSADSYRNNAIGSQATVYTDSTGFNLLILRG